MCVRVLELISQDVEGAEDTVLASVDPARFSVVVMEAAGYPDDGGRLERIVEPLLLRAGFKHVRSLESHIKGAWNPVYIRTHGPMTQHCIGCAHNTACRQKYLGQ